MYLYVPYVSGSTSKFPHFLKNLQFTGLFSSRMMWTIQSSPQPAKYFQHFLHTEKRMKRYSLIKKKSCLWLPFSIFLFCPPKIKLFLNCAHVSNISPLLPSSELCNSSAALGTDWSWTSDRQTDDSQLHYLLKVRLLLCVTSKNSTWCIYYATTSKLYTSHLLMQSTSVTVKLWSVQEMKEIVDCLSKTMLITKEKTAYFKMGGHLQVSPLQCDNIT